MDANNALKIIRSLAVGHDPSSGAPLTHESVFQKPEVIRALFMAAEALRDKPPRGEVVEMPGTGGLWSPAEDAQLVASFKKSAAIKAMAKEHGRTRGAIRSRLRKLGLIDY